MAGKFVRSGPLTWAQAAEFPPLFWRRHGEWHPLHARPWHLAEHTAVDTARAAWAAMASRHEVLRTSFALDPTGRPVQRVAHPDDFTPPITTAPLHEYEEFMARQHRLDPDGPLWAVTIFHEDGIARGSVLLAEHVLYDAVGLRNWRAQVDDLVADPGALVEVAQPIDLATEEPGEDHPRLRRARDRYDDSLTRCAQVLIPATRQEGANRYLRSVATFSGMATAVDAIARRCDTSASTVVTYVVGWLIARLARHRRLPVDVLYGNRSAKDQSIVAQVQHVFYSLDFTVAPPSTGIKALAHATIGAFAHGRMPRSVAAQVRSAASARRGVGIQEPLMINVLTGSHARFDIPGGHEWRGAGVPFLNKVAIAMDDEGFDISLTVDAAMLTVADTTAILADLPTAIAHVHDHPDRPLDDHPGWRTRPFPLDDGLVRVGQDWARPHRVAELIAAVPGVRAAEVAVDGGELVATVAADPGVTYLDIHERLLATVLADSDVVAPTRYRPFGAEEDTWHVADREPVHPVTAAELALREAFRRAHGVAPADFGQTYVTAGGVLDLVPAVVTALADLGYTGSRSTMFTAPLTLRAIARALTGPPGGHRRAGQSAQPAVSRIASHVR